MLKRIIGSWLDERTGIIDPARKLLYKPVSGGAKYIFSLGSLNMFLFVNQVVTGIFLMLYYAPTPDHAYEAVRFIQTEAPFGYMVRGLHFWGASAMIVSVMLHALRVFVFGAYKKPREVMWLSGSVMLLLVFAFAFTGYLLPWDQKAYWATVVGTNVGGTAPVVGGIVVRLMRGGADITAVTLTRFFAVHTMVLPWTLAAVMGLHLTVLQYVDHTPPWDPEKAKKSAPFYPDQVFKDATAIFFVFALIVFLSNVSQPHLEPIADPTDNTYNPRPEWYFFFLFQLLRYFEGPFEVVGTMILPNLFVGMLLLLPFVDRSPERSPKKRPIAMTCAGLVAAGYVALTILAVLYPAGGAAQPSPGVTEGRMLYSKLGCGSCHAINGVGGVVAPELTHVATRRDREWIREHFKDPQKMVPGSVMPKYDYLTDVELDRLTDYMMSLNSAEEK